MKAKCCGSDGALVDDVQLSDSSDANCHSAQLVAVSRRSNDARLTIVDACAPLLSGSSACCSFLPLSSPGLPRTFGSDHTVPVWDAAAAAAAAATAAFSAQWRRAFRSFNRHHVPPELTSFNMANISLECLDQVDLVSDAENIKKLIKMAFDKNAEVSMTVHRVGRLLLLNNYDLHDHLLHDMHDAADTMGAASGSQWAWLDTLLRECFTTASQGAGDDDKDDGIGCTANRLTSTSHHVTSRAHVDSTATSYLYGQLLAHAHRRRRRRRQYNPLEQYQQQQQQQQRKQVEISSDSSRVVQQQSPAPSLLALPPPPPPLPPVLSVQAAPPSVSSSSAKYRRRYLSRNMLWTFQDMKMLIGTDLPILGGGTHPCVSVRLHDVSQRINVLTGLDYWLDNLMSNVPEVLMCYHLDGVLKQYSLLRTDELPRLADCSFSPEIVHDVAENILSFLRENATKTGHTYWLFKGEQDECVKLYDLSSLLRQRYDNITLDDNPFTAHVALLLYRIACNMIKSSHTGADTGGDHVTTVRTLLTQCLQLIQSDKYLQVRANVLLMLTECYVPRRHAPLSTRFPASVAVDSSVAASHPDAYVDASAGAAVADEQVPASTVEWQARSCSVVNLRRLTLKGGVAQSAPERQSVTASAAAAAADRQPIAGDALQRTADALTLVVRALVCVRQQEQEQRRRRRTRRDSGSPVPPPDVIPMPYCRLDGDNSASSAATDAAAVAGAAVAVGEASSVLDSDVPPAAAAATVVDGDVSATLLLQKAGQVCAVRAAALWQLYYSDGGCGGEYRDDSGQLCDALSACLHTARVALVCVCAAANAATDGRRCVPEVSAAATVTLASAVMTLVRRLRDQGRSTTDSTPPGHCAHADRCRLTERECSMPSELRPLWRYVAEHSDQAEKVFVFPADGCNDTVSGRRFLADVECLLHFCCGLQLCGNSRRRVRSHLGLVMNERALDIMRSLPAAPLDGATGHTSRGAASSQQAGGVDESPVLDKLTSVEHLFQRTVRLLDGCDELSAVEFNVFRLYERWSALVECRAIGSRAAPSISSVATPGRSHSKASVAAASPAVDAGSDCTSSTGAADIVEGRDEVLEAAAMVSARAAELLVRAIEHCSRAVAAHPRCRSAGDRRAAVSPDRHDASDASGNVGQQQSLLEMMVVRRAAAASRCAQLLLLSASQSSSQHASASASPRTSSTDAASCERRLRWLLGQCDLTTVDVWLSEAARRSVAVITADLLVYLAQQLRASSCGASARRRRQYRSEMDSVLCRAGQLYHRHATQRPALVLNTVYTLMASHKEAMDDCVSWQEQFHVIDNMLKLVTSCDQCPLYAVCCTSVDKTTTNNSSPQPSATTAPCDVGDDRQVATLSTATRQLAQLLMLALRNALLLLKRHDHDRRCVVERYECMYRLALSEFGAGNSANSECNTASLPDQRDVTVLANIVQCIHQTLHK